MNKELALAALADVRAAREQDIAEGLWPVAWADEHDFRFPRYDQNQWSSCFAAFVIRRAGWEVDLYQATKDGETIDVCDAAARELGLEPVEHMDAYGDAWFSNSSQPLFMPNNTIKDIELMIDRIA